MTPCLTKQSVVSTATIRSEKEALLKVDGVTSAKVDLEQKKATIEADSTVSDKALKDAVSDAGYKAKFGFFK